jgi:hypothetical protein
MSMTFKAALLAAMLVPLAASAATHSDRAKAKKPRPFLNSSPMVYYLAKGEDDACGQGCSEWIAAEGQIDADAAQRLRAFLNRLGKRKLPIFFQSPGGNGTTSTVMGRLLRERGMTTGVSETVPTGCKGVSEALCRTLKRSGRVLPATLRNVSACNSACVFALIGGKVRQVPPGARLGVHSAKVVVLRTDGHKPKFSARQIASFQKNKLAELNVQFRRYVQEMNIDVGLFDLLSRVPHENVHYLSRDEIVDFGIDTREFREAHWVATELAPSQLSTMKYFIEPKGGSRDELLTSVIRLECGGKSGAKLSYFRSLGSREAGTMRTIRLAVGDQRTVLSVAGPPFKMEAIESGTLYNLWYAYASYDFLEGAVARGTVDIIESETIMHAPRVTTLSTAGLSQAIMALRLRCKGASLCPPSASNGAGAGPAVCKAASRT